MGYSIINHPAMGVPPLMETPMYCFPKHPLPVMTWSLSLPLLRCRTFYHNCARRSGLAACTMPSGSRLAVCPVIAHHQPRKSWILEKVLPFQNCSRFSKWMGYFKIYQPIPQLQKLKTEPRLPSPWLGRPGIGDKDLPSARHPEELLMATDFAHTYIVNVYSM